MIVAGIIKRQRKEMKRYEQPFDDPAIQTPPVK